MQPIDGKLNVKMLGGFQMFWNQREVLLKSGPSTKALQILQLLLYNAPEKISSASIISRIFAYDDVLNPNNNLKASISLLRRQLGASCLPDADYISYQDNGYVWCPELPPEVDAHRFETIIREADVTPQNGDKIRLYKEAISLYGGAFLPSLVGVDWVETLNVYYGNLYAGAVRELAGLLMRSGRHEEVLTLTERAYRLQHSDEWQILRMQCLMELGRWDEAKQVYMDAVTVMSRDFDVQPSAELVEQYHIISSKINNALGTFHDMLDDVRESEDIGGAYFCAFPGFIDSCRVTIRSMARNGISCFLILCSLCDGNGTPLQHAERLDDASEKLRHAIQKSLRRSDFFTQYNQSQFLAFLLGTCLEHCVVIERRIDNNFHEMSVRGVRLTFEAHSAMQVDTDSFMQSSAPLTWH